MGKSNSLVWWPILSGVAIGTAVTVFVGRKGFKKLIQRDKDPVPSEGQFYTRQNQGDYL